MTATVVDIGRFRGRFFEVLQETTLSQTAVMTIGPGRTPAPRRRMPETRSSTSSRARRSSASTMPNTVPWRAGAC